MDEVIEIKFESVKECIDGMKENLKNQDKKIDKINDDITDLNQVIVKLDKKIDKIFTYGSIILFIITVFIMPVVTALISHYFR